LSEQNPYIACGNSFKTYHPNINKPTGWAIM